MTEEMRGWFGDDDVVGAVLGREPGLGVVDADVAPRIRERGGIARSEAARGLRHGGLDLYGVHRFELEVAEQGVGGNSGPDADDRYAPRLGLDRERERRREGHRGLIRKRRAAHVDAAIRFAVGADRAPIGEIDEAYARRAPVLIEDESGVLRCVKPPVPEYPGHHAVKVELHGG
jgi:hypothetical protein